MPAAEKQKQFLVTGSSGFVGSHLCRRLCECYPAESVIGVDLEPPIGPARHRHVSANISGIGSLVEAKVLSRQPKAIFHLAASAEVLTPWADVPVLLSSNLQGMHTVLQGLDSELVVFASSSSVYGNSGLHPAHPRLSPVNPLCLYAFSKLTGEMLLRDWIRQSGRRALVFRFGNVIGPRCRGLIRYLIQHIVRYPQGGVVARLRGGGRLLRDYVPVSYVVDVMTTLSRKRWDPGAVVTLNLGTGKAMSNRDVAEIVGETAKSLGFRLETTFTDPAGPGEADEVVLNVEDTVARCGFGPPREDEVRRAIAASVRESLEAYAGAGHTRTVSA